MKQQTYDFSALDFSRVAVIGSAGSGKTTFSKSIGKLFDRSVTHLDKILWGENWTEQTIEQQLQILQPVVHCEGWIIDGTWLKTLDVRYKRATLVIFLHFKPTLCAWRAFKRSLKNRGKQRDDLAKGCVEKINWSFYRYILRFGKNSLPQIRQLQADNANVPLVTLKTPKQAKKFLDELQKYLTDSKKQKC